MIDQACFQFGQNCRNCQTFVAAIQRLRSKVRPHITRKPFTCDTDLLRKLIMPVRKQGKFRFRNVKSKKGYKVRVKKQGFAAEAPAAAAIGTDNNVDLKLKAR